MDPVQIGGKAVVNRQRGLTLVELMVVVAVMAIIAAIAYPLYTSQVQKSRRADAKIALEGIAMAQERFFTINGGYATGLGSLQVSTALQGGGSDQGYYTIAITQPCGSDQCFSATATAASGGAQAGDADCSSFSINQLGVKAATNGSGTKCW